MDVKRRVKRAAQRLVAAARPERWPRPRPALLVLMYHRVLPRGESPGVPVQPGMFVHDDTFEQHLRLLRTRFTPVSLAEWTARAGAGRTLPKRAVAVTFDDGWVDNYRHAFPLLQRYGFPATIFLVSDFVGTRRLFWPERLGLLLPGLNGRTTPWLRALAQTAEANGIDAAIVQAKARGDEEIIAELEAAAAPPEVPRQLLDWEEVLTMGGSGLVEFGSHTRTHTRLRAGLPEALIEHEVAGSKRMLEDRLGRPVDLFCYPNGDRCAAARSRVRGHYRAACTTEKGWNRAGAGTELRRIGIHQGVAGDEVAFMARLSGWL